MKRNGSYLRQYLPWLGLLLGVDALAEFRTQAVEGGVRAHPSRRRPATRPTVTATTAKARPIQVCPLHHHATVAAT